MMAHFMLNTLVAVLKQYQICLLKGLLLSIYVNEI